MLSSFTSTVADSFGGFCSFFTAFLVSFLGAAASYDWVAAASSAAELAERACSTAASLDAKSACLAVSASSAAFLVFSAISYSACYFFFVFLSTACLALVSTSFCSFSNF